MPDTRPDPGRRKGAWRDYAVVSLGAAAALSLAAILLLNAQANRLRGEIEEGGAPSRELASELQIAYSRHVYNLNNYLVTGETTFLDGYLGALAEERAKGVQLTTLLPTFDPVAARAWRVLDARLDRWNQPVAELLASRSTRQEFEAMAVERDALHADILAASASLQQAVNRGIARRVEGIERAQALQVFVAAVLTLLALTAALERARIARREASARREAERRALDELALREAAAAVASALTVDETIRKIAESALVSTEADGAAVTRIDGALDRLELIASSGTVDFASFEDAPYAGSLTWLAVSGAAPVRYPDNSRGAAAVSGVGGALRDHRLVCAPLFGEDEPLGSLTVIREPNKRHFDAEEVARIRTFADLASLELRRVQMLAEAQEQRRKLERVTDSRSRLVRGFSHDVKNALGAADGHAYLLSEGIVGELDSAQRKSVQRLRRSLRDAIQLTEDLLDLAHAEEGEIAISVERIDIAAVTRQSVEEYRPQAAARRISLRLELADPLPTLDSDPRRIRQVLGNLLSNAVKFTPEGGEVRVSARAVGERAPELRSWICIEVEDSGSGIPSEQVERVFDEFTRLAPGVPGTGVGLAISRRVARALGGDVTLVSSVGEGSRFTVWLPAGRRTRWSRPRVARSRRG